MDNQPIGQEQTRPEQYVRLVTQLCKEVMMTGTMPADLPPELDQNNDLHDLLNQISALQQFAFALANGNLDPEIKIKGRVAGSLKALQANLRHLTWQTQRIASGDLSQRVAFMGEFATAFNLMVEHLAHSRQELELRAQELVAQRHAALDLMVEAQTAREEVERANQRLHEQILEIQTLQELLKDQAIRDPLTGCFNRRYLQETLEREFARARRDNSHIAIILFDIDHFKTVNDTFGHKIGDMVLQALVQLMLKRTRQSDVVARYGGEEFIIMLPNTTLSTAHNRAEDLRLAFAETVLQPNTQPIRNTVSAGVACFPIHGAHESTIIEKADQALYRAKSSGRNQVMLAI